jgi:ArsR family transcriptional regulator
MRTLALFHAALADETRLRLLCLMRGGEVCVCHLQGVLGTNQPKISRHLAYLKRTGLVEARRDGRWMHYRLRKLEDGLSRSLAVALDQLHSEPKIRADR